MYFQNFPTINYKIDNQYREMQNIVLSTNAVNDIYSPQYFDSMVIQEQTPEELSFEIYRDTQYYWVLLYVNNIVNPFEDWVISSELLEDYCINKYGSEEAILEPKYFYNIITKQILVGVEEEKAMEEWKTTGSVPLGINMITVYEYEQTENDKKRYIRYVPVSKLLSFVDRYETAIKEL